jgi:hypothetical protein
LDGVKALSLKGFYTGAYQDQESGWAPLFQIQRMLSTKETLLHYRRKHRITQVAQESKELEFFFSPTRSERHEIGMVGELICQFAGVEGGETGGWTGAKQ